MEKELELLKSLLAENFKYYKYPDAIKRLRERDIHNNDIWSNVRKIVNDELLPLGYAFSLVAFDANLPLDEDTEEEAYKWLKLFIRNIDAEGNIIEYGSICQNNWLAPYKTHLGRSFTKEEWEAYEAEEYKKYIDKRNKKTNSLFVEENPPQDFALETNGLREIKHFVMNSRSEQVPVYQYPSTMVAPIAFLPNGTVVEVLKKGDDGWCEVLSKDRKKGFIQSNFVKDN